MLAGGLIETVPVGGGDPCLVVPVDVKITTAGAILSHSVFAGGLLEAVPVGDEGGDHYLVVPVEKNYHSWSCSQPQCACWRTT